VEYAVELDRVAASAYVLAAELSTSGDSGNAYDVHIAKVRCRATVLRSVVTDLERFAEHYQDAPTTVGDLIREDTEYTGGEV